MSEGYSDAMCRSDQCKSLKSSVYSIKLTVIRSIISLYFNRLYSVGLVWAKYLMIIPLFYDILTLEMNG